MHNSIRDRARELRTEGHSIGEIVKLLNVSKSSVSLWVRDIPLTEAQIARLAEKQHRFGNQSKGGKANREKFLKIRQASQQEGREYARFGRPLHLAGCMLYWAEGAKARNMIYFVNTDANMLKFFIRFLREELLVSDNEMTVTIHCHYADRENQQRVEQYWLEILQLPETALRKTQYKKGSEYRKNTLVNGVCGLRVGSTHLAQHVYGAIQEYAGFDHPEWLF